MGKLTITNTINLTVFEYSRCKPFFEAVQAGRWETAKDFYIQHPEAVRVRHPSSGKTALHIAVEAGHVDIVRELVSLTGFDYSRCKPFFEAVQAGRWETARDFHIQHPEAVRVRHPFSGKTALHIAVEAGHVDIVRELVSLMEEDDLEIKSTGDDYTALAIAAIEGITEMAECMVTRNKKLLSISDAFNDIPLVHACVYGHWHVARYLYSVTPLEDLMPDKGPHGATIISNCFLSKEFGKSY
ncbi:probable E3 ubiquitin-protein ligase XBOS36 [Pyrus communis]|uniref:probable E3 ubiquitin-protein ligase XBOS36 n=1 Tax=Pyrus communis TaxID=23211 RepID=UPI0035C10FF2